MTSPNQIDWNAVASRLDQYARELHALVASEPAERGRHIASAALVCLGLRDAIRAGTAAREAE